MFLVRLGEYPLVLQKILNLCEQSLLFVIMMTLDELVPSKGVADEIRFIEIGHLGCL